MPQSFMSWVCCGIKLRALCVMGPAKMQNASQPMSHIHRHMCFGCLESVAGFEVKPWGVWRLNPKIQEISWLLFQ